MNNFRFGVYFYTHRISGKVVYIGLDSNINKMKRHHDHLTEKNSNNKFNNHLQKAPNMYVYGVYCLCDSREKAEDIEAVLIRTYKEIGECELNIVDELV